MHPSNTALGYLPELLSPAPLRCGVGKGTPNSMVKVLHTHKTQTCVQEVLCRILSLEQLLGALKDRHSYSGARKYGFDFH